MVVRIAGERMYLRRAVDDEGEVLDMLVQRRRDTRSALRLMRKLLKKQRFVPKLLVSDKLRSYGSAFRRLRLSCRHEQGLRKNKHARGPDDRREIGAGRFAGEGRRWRFSASSGRGGAAIADGERRRGVDRRRALRAQRRADHLAQRPPRPHPGYPPRRAAAAHPEIAAG